MARLKQELATESEWSDESCSTQQKTNRRVQRGGAILERRSSPRKQSTKPYVDDGDTNHEFLAGDDKLQPKRAFNASQQGKQIRLAPLSAFSASKSLPCGPSSAPKTSPKRIINPMGARLTYQLALAKLYPTPAPLERDGSTEGLVALEVEESVWCGSDANASDSEGSLPSPRKFLRLPRKLEAQTTRVDGSTMPTLDLSKRLEELTINGARPLVGSFDHALQPTSRPPSSSDKENNCAFLHFTPPRLYSPAKPQQPDKPVTPPQSPSKSRLQSPSKTRIRIPTPPIRQSLDGFWNAESINDWNDQYSPKKILKSPKKLKFLRDDASTSPTSSPRKVHSPTKATRAERDAKKEFEARKHDIANDFLDDLDRVVTGGKIRQLSESSGGVKFIWSKTLNSTAGRANWRRETTKKKLSDGTNSTTHKHFASIELAEKVIDDEHRLLNVIAHEFCHLATFMVSEIKDQPHGRQFKEWGRKTTTAFAHRGVEVTTKHSYQIEYKYIWQCSNEDCAAEFKRHSKSIDPKRHTCGTCRSKLVQIKPVPRKDAGGAATGYAAYVKMHFADVKKSMPDASQKDVMEAVGRKYRTDKASSLLSSSETAVKTENSATAVDVEDVTRELEVIVLDDD